MQISTVESHVQINLQALGTSLLANTAPDEDVDTTDSESGSVYSGLSEDDYEDSEDEDSELESDFDDSLKVVAQSDKLRQVL